MDYVNLLLDAINRYDENNVESTNKLRDIVCIVSDNEGLKKDPLIRELLYTASQKMRVFGYNVQNGFYRQEVNIEQNKSDLMYLRNQSILNRYRSKVRKNNILDKSQQNIIDFYQSLEKKRMLVSAPTSYGKTFIMREILYLNRQKYNTVLLVFPTVALLRENALNMETLNREKELGYNIVRSLDNEIKIQERNIFVFTPERAMLLLANYPEIKVDFFFYDEMYKIDEDYCTDDTETERITTNPYRQQTFLDESRAKTFRICLYILSKKAADYYLAGPNLKKEKFGLGMRRYLASNDIKVKEIEFEPTKRIQVTAYKNKITENYTDIPFLAGPQSVSIRSKVNDRICDVVSYIKERGYGSTLLYCTTPTKANEYATKLSQNDQGKEISDKRFRIFVEHLKRNYNINGSVDEWSFVNVLEKGFGMHHGKMPKYIQKEVLDLFNDGVFDLLFCTSTIVEGVNTNAKNMVVLNHTKGTNELTVFDFKNIIGRAGRYYHNFVGRYFLVDKVLEKFDTADDMELNFITYDEAVLDAVDIDNSEYSDLSSENKLIKERRREEQKNYLLTEEVFRKNRLIKKEYQENLLRCLMYNSTLFEKFYRYTTYPDILNQFITYHAMSTVLDIFYDAQLLEEAVVFRYKAISNTYCNEGLRGLLKYEIDNARKEEVDRNGRRRQNKNIDRAYMDAFKTQKEIIEHKFPQLLALFETIFMYAADRKGRKMESFTLSKVVRFYETGVKSYFGEQLIEFGFPIDAVRKIEDYNPELLYKDADMSRKYIQENYRKIDRWLDEYEKILMGRALQSIFNLEVLAGF